MSHKPLTDDEGEVRELSAADFARMRPAAEVLPEILGSALAGQLLKKRGRPPKAAVKRQVNLRLSPEVIDYFRASGPGWQTRIDEVLKAWLATQH